jgi:hypothetical protein
VGRGVEKGLEDGQQLGRLPERAGLMFGGQFAFIAGSSFVLIGVLGVSPSVFGLCFGTVALGIMTGTFLSGRFGGSGSTGPLSWGRPWARPRASSWPPSPGAVS